MRKKYSNGMDKKPRGPIGVKNEGKGYRQTWKSKKGMPNVLKSGKVPEVVAEYRSATVRKLRDYIRRYNDSVPRDKVIKKVSYMNKHQLIRLYKKLGGKIRVAGKSLGITKKTTKPRQIARAAAAKAKKKVKGPPTKKKVVKKLVVKGPPTKKKKSKAEKLLKKIKEKKKVKKKT